MEDISSAAYKINTVEKRSGIARRVRWPELGRIEKTARALGVECEKVAPGCAAQRQRGILADCAEGTVVHQKAPGWFLTETRSRNGVDDETGLIAVLGGRRA